VRVLQYCVVYKDFHVAQLLLASPSTGSILLYDSMVRAIAVNTLSVCCASGHPPMLCMHSSSVIGGSSGTAAADCEADAPTVQQRRMCPQGGDGDN
jgi:hypothetical protein